MNRTRLARQAGTLLVALCLAAGVAGAAPAGWTRDDAAHLLRRAGFGGTPAQVDAIYDMGKGPAVEFLLSGQLPPGVTRSPFDPAQVPAIADAVAAGRALAGAGGKGKNAGAKAARQQAAVLAANNPNAAAPAVPGAKPLTAAKVKNAARKAEVEALRTDWVERMLRTDAPLPEKMSLFWHGLFCTGAKEIKDGDALVAQNELFHAQALGNYKALTHAIVHDAAMIKYLNNDQNVKGRPNENLARELMELFTMGEGQGYTERDIGEVARALTGLGPLVAAKEGKNNAHGAVVLKPALHDGGVKTIFGQQGNYGPDDVVELIFARPEPANHLARKLWQFFASPEPTDADLAPVVAALRESKYDVRAALRALFTSEAFYGERVKFALIKSPAEVVVETARTLGATVDAEEVAGLVKSMELMDQQLLQPPNVRGWVGGEHWITAATLFTRYNTATALVNGSVSVRAMKGNGGGRAGAGGAVDARSLFPSLASAPTAEQVVDAAIARFLQRPLNAEKRQALLEALGTQPLRFGEPETDRRVREVVALVLSTPEFQVH